MRALRGLTATDIQSRQLSLQWENLAFNLTRCHTYSVSLCYRYTTAGGGGGHNTTVRECLAVEHNASRFTLRDLPPYHGIYVRLSLANPEGKKEGREVTFQTEEDSKSQEGVIEKIAWKQRTTLGQLCLSLQNGKEFERNYPLNISIHLVASLLGIPR